MSKMNAKADTKPRRSQLSFSLRMLVLLIVFFSFYFAWVGRTLHRFLHQRAIVAKLESLGGEVEYEERPGSLLIKYFVGEHAYDHVVSVGMIGDEPFQDDELALLTELREIKHLGLHGSHITDRAMQYVAQLPKLEFLALNATSVTADGLAQLSAVDGLEVLYIGGVSVDGVTVGRVPITDDMLKSIGTLSHLRQLGFMETKFTSIGFEHLAGLPHLSGLAFMDSSMSEGPQNLDKLQNLDVLILYNVSFPGDGSLQLFGSPRLKRIMVWRTKISEASYRHLADLHNLESLELNNESITDDVLVHLAGLHQLEKLDLRYTEVSDDGLVHLKGLGNLESLDLDDTNVSDDGLVHLKGLEKLQCLGLRDTDVSDAGLEHLASIKSLTYLYLDDSKVSADGVALVKNLDGLGADFDVSKQTVIDELERLFPSRDVQ